MRIRNKDNRREQHVKIDALLMDEKDNVVTCVRDVEDL